VDEVMEERKIELDEEYVPSTPIEKGGVGVRMYDVILPYCYGSAAAASVWLQHPT
jgi:hypothetical protein